MYKIKSILLIFIFNASLFSQGFTFVRISPPIVIGSTSQYEIPTKAVINPLSGTLQIRLIRIIEELSPSWDSFGTGICNYVACYPPDVDTVISTYSSSTNTDDTITIYFYNYYNEGAGFVRMRAELVSNPSQYIEQDFRAVTPGYIGIKPISNIATEYSLSQNYPNPFNPFTIINFTIPVTQYVTLKIYDILGREVRSLINTDLTPGEYEIEFDATGLSSGMYYYCLKAGEFVAVKKMVLVK